MASIYLRNLPDELYDRPAFLAGREGLSVSAFAVRELSVVARRAHNASLLADLPDLSVDPVAVVSALDAGRADL